MLQQSIQIKVTTYGETTYIYVDKQDENYTYTQEKSNPDNTY